MIIKPENCPKCGGKVWSVEYVLTDKNHYDGVSEWSCVNALQPALDGNISCNYRMGRFCGTVLSENEVEPRFCEGNQPHPKSI